MKRIMWLLLVASALVACGGSPGQVEPTTAAAAATEAPPTPEPTAEATATATPADTVLDPPAANCCSGRALPPGRYRLPAWQGLPLSFEVGEGWRVLNEERARLLLIGRGANVLNNPSQIITFIDATGESVSPESLMAGVQLEEGLMTLTDPVPMTIAGLSGMQVDLVARPNPTEKGNASIDIPPGIQFLPFFRSFFAPGFLWSTSSPEARVRVIALEVGEQTLLLYLEAPPDEFDAFAANAEAVLQSLQSPISQSPNLQSVSFMKIDRVEYLFYDVPVS